MNHKNFLDNQPGEGSYEEIINKFNAWDGSLF